MLSFVSKSHLFRNANKYFILVQCCHSLFKTQLNLQRGVTSTEHLYILTANSVHSLNNISSFVIVLEMPCVYCEVGIGCLYFICAKFFVPFLRASRIFGETFGCYVKEIPNDVSQRFLAL